MSETGFSSEDIDALDVLANGIIPPDERDEGAASVEAGREIAERVARGLSSTIYREGLEAARVMAQARFGIDVPQLDSVQIHELLGQILDQSPTFFRQLRADVCAIYLSDPAVWKRIGFPGPSTESGGYPDFDQPQ